MVASINRTELCAVVLAGQSLACPYLPTVGFGQDVGVRIRTQIRSLDQARTSLSLRDK